MSKKATEFQKREMSKMYRGKEIFKPLNTGWVDERVACVREWVANIFFYRKGGTTIMIDAGYNYDRLEEKMGWLGIDPTSIRHILITHQDTDHVGAVEADSPGLFRSAKLYIGEIENRYLTGKVRRKVIYHLYKLPQVTINNEKVLLHDGETFEIDGIKIECFLVPGHTWGHMVYLIDDKYLFTGDTLWFGADGGYSFISSLAESNKLAVKSLAALEQKLQSRNLHPLFLTGHTGWTDNFEFAFAHKDKLCSPFKKRVPDPSAPYDAYDESDDTEKNGKERVPEGSGKMKVYSFGAEHAPVILLLPGTCCHWKGNFGRVIPLLADSYRVLCISYDGFDETEHTEFPTILEETEKIETYIQEHSGGHIRAAYGCSLGGSFVGLLAARQNIHMDYGILGSSDLDQASPIAAKLQTNLILPLIYPFIRDGRFKSRLLQKRLTQRKSEMGGYVQAFMEMLGGARPYVTVQSCKNQFYSDLVTPLPDKINVPGTEIHIFYALKMGEKYRERYERHFANPAIHEQDLQHEELLACYPECWVQLVKDIMEGKQ